MFSLLYIVLINEKNRRIMKKQSPLLAMVPGPLRKVGQLKTFMYIEEFSTVCVHFLVGPVLVILHTKVGHSCKKKKHLKALKSLLKSMEKLLGSPFNTSTFWGFTFLLKKKNRPPKVQKCKYYVFQVLPLLAFG